MAAMINDNVTAGPAWAPAAAAVLTNKPAPMIAPIPRATRLPAVRVLLRPVSEDACSNKTVSDFFRNKLIQFVDCRLK